MKVNIIAAVASNWVIGYQGKIPWHIQEDLNRFKALTTEHAVIMGRLTWQSLPVKPLPKRLNIVITRDNSLLHVDDYSHIKQNSLKVAIDCIPNVYEKVFIIGGTKLYKEALDSGIVSTMYITHVHKEYQGDTYFPDVDFSQWKEVEREDFEGYSFVKYDKV